MYPGNSLYHRRFKPPSPNGSARIWQLPNDNWHLKDTHHTVFTRRPSPDNQLPVTDICIKRQKMEENLHVFIPMRVDHLSEIECDNNLLFPEDRVQLGIYDNNNYLYTPNASPLSSYFSLGPLFLKSITGDSYRKKYLQLLESLLACTKRYSSNGGLDTDHVSTSHSAISDSLQNASSSSLFSAPRIIIRSVICRSLFIDAVYLLIHTTPNAITLPDLEQSARWFITNVPRSIWFSDHNGLNVGIRICQDAIKYNNIRSAPISFLYSYFKASNLPLDTSPGKESSMTISMCHLKLGLELYLLMYRYCIIRKTIVFASAHSLNAELQSLAVHTNARRMHFQLTNISTDIKALQSKKTALQAFRESLPAAATRMNQRVQCLKMALSDVSMKILRHQKKHSQSKEYWRAKSVELEQNTAQQRKAQQALQDEMHKLEQQIKSSTLKKERAVEGFEKMQSGVDQINAKLNTKETDFKHLEERARTLEQRIADKGWKIDEIQATQRRELEDSLSAMKAEFNRIDVLVSAVFSENSPTDLHSIITNIQSYVARVSKTKNINTELPELSSLENAIIAVQKTGLFQVISNSLFGIQKTNCIVPSRLLGLMTATGISIQQRTSLLKDFGAFLDQKRPQITAYCIVAAKRNTPSLVHNNKPSSPLKSNQDISVVITSGSIQSKLCFQRSSDDMTTPDTACNNNEGNTEPPKSAPRGITLEATPHPHKAEPLSLFGAPIPWSLLQYKYSSSWTVEQNIMQYLRQTCTLDDHTTSFHCHKDLPNNQIIEESKKFK